MWFKTPVKFHVKPAKGADLGEIVRILEKSGVSASPFDSPELNVCLIFCDAKRKIYESLFDAKVDYKNQKWVEVEPAKIPERLKDKVESVRLEAYGSLCGKTKSFL